MNTEVRVACPGGYSVSARLGPNESKDVPSCINCKGRKVKVRRGTIGASADCDGPSEPLTQSYTDRNNG